MSTSEGVFPMETTYAWRDAPNGGTLMTLRNRGEPAGFAKLTAPREGARGPEEMSVCVHQRQSLAVLYGTGTTGPAGARAS